MTRIQSLQPHFAKTLDMWAEALEAHKDEAIEIQSEEVYERYMKFLTGLRRRCSVSVTSMSTSSRWRNS